MSTPSITTKTPEQIDADFAAEFADVRPLGINKPLTLAQRLAPYRKAIMKQRVRGLSWRQIAEVMRRPRINEKVSGKSLQEIFGRPSAKTAKTAGAANLMPDRLVLDPVTGIPVPPTPPVAPAPMTAKEHEQFDPLLRDLVPPIVKTKQNRSNAWSYAKNAVEMMRPKDAERFHELFNAELDALTETNCSRYALAPDLIAPWKRKWV